jgi:hypothetical protein
METVSSTGLKKCSNSRCLNPRVGHDGLLSATEFNKNRAMKDGLANWCRVCMKNHFDSIRVVKPKKPTDKKKCANPNCTNTQKDQDGYLPLGEFYRDKYAFLSVSPRCKVCSSVKTKTYWNKNKEILKKKSLVWRSAHRKECVEASTKWRNANKARCNEYSSGYKRLKYASNTQYRLSMRLRNRFREALQSSLDDRKVSAVSGLGCSLEFLKLYIESKWVSGMSWNNWGRGEDKWHIDHIVPLAKFDLSIEEQQKKAIHYTNLQPLWEQDNLSKGSKVV